MLLLDSDNIVTFNLALSGTSQPPVVRVLVSLETTVMYAAQGTDGKYQVNIKLPPDTKPGTYDFCVEVTVGGRVFTPLKSTFEVGSIEIQINDFSFGEPAPQAAPASVQVVQSVPVQTASFEAKESKPNFGDAFLKMLRESPLEHRDSKPAVPAVQEAVAPPASVSGSEISFIEQMQVLAGIKPPRK